MPRRWANGAERDRVHESGHFLNDPGGQVEFVVAQQLDGRIVREADARLTHKRLLPLAL